MDNELKSLIEEIKDILNEVKNNQKNEIKEIEKKHKIYMKNLSKLIEFNQILDMTNQVFDRRISGIENLLQKIKNNNR